ncbi:MAG: DUF4037 domain-containing protein [Clostridia bacterium]|nr:DUF4037 domain-containing protein [Clostridia bacterium]
MEKGLELSRAYYEEYGIPMLKEFPDLSPMIAVGLVGSGSECFGYDDEISRDHDFEPGFCLFLPGEDKIDRQAAFRLERAYAKLPKEFHGVRRSILSPVGGNRHGVLRTAEFYESKVGSPTGDLTTKDWLTISENYLLEATNGEVFSDPYGEFSAIRQKLSRFPADIRKKKLAGSLLLMSQSGQYNYLRCVAHGESGGAALAAGEFVKYAMQALFLLANRYLPYYKWRFRALREIEPFANLAETLEFLLVSENDEAMAKIKADAMEDVSLAVITELQNQNLTDAVCGDLEKHATSVNDKIDDPTIRNLHILAGV